MEIVRWRRCFIWQDFKYFSHRFCGGRERLMNGGGSKRIITQIWKVYDVMMSDIIRGRETLQQYRGIVFVGGFSFGDVLGSAKGWAAKIRHHSTSVTTAFRHFIDRHDTFTLGVCNGCQLMSLLGLCPFPDLDEESRWVFLIRPHAPTHSSLLHLSIPSHNIRTRSSIPPASINSSPPPPSFQANTSEQTAPFHPQRIQTLRVPFCDAAHREIPIDLLSKYGRFYIRMLVVTL